ncbi:MAG: 50S ribosomal protein L29 [Phycisphaeraceae bacterium]|nr:50S ribosomal protein L29 [Phycisphaeraceae bacterium]
MKARDARKLSIEEIDIEVGRLRKRQFELRTQAVTEKIQDTSQFGVLRRDIARLLTERRVKSGAKVKA